MRMSVNEQKMYNRGESKRGSGTKKKLNRFLRNGAIFIKWRHIGGCSNYFKNFKSFNVPYISLFGSKICYFRVKTLSL